MTDPRKEKRSTYWHIFLKADSGWPGDCNRFSNSGGCWGGYHRANLTSKGSFCWNLGLSLGLSQCNTSRGCNRALHFHRRISRLLSVFNILGVRRGKDIERLLNKNWKSSITLLSLLKGKKSSQNTHLAHLYPLLLAPFWSIFLYTPPYILP